QSQLQTPEQFRQITLRVNQDGSLVTLGNVATVELGGMRITPLPLQHSKLTHGYLIQAAGRRCRSGRP
ncbi:hypothetical protein, partial [Enterobacter hormaechei]|uniref:hypothetical protein n=1 Tax=Enterobacter hormaechei TaxID=158836 RepID=UPI0013CF52A5